MPKPVGPYIGHLGTWMPDTELMFALQVSGHALVRCFLIYSVFFPSRLWMPALPFCIGMCSFPFFLHRLMARSLPWVSGETLNMCLWVVLKMLRFHSISGDGLNASCTMTILGPHWRVTVSCVECSVSIWGALVWEVLETLGVGLSWKK